MVFYLEDVCADVEIGMNELLLDLITSGSAVRSTLKSPKTALMTMFMS